MQARHETRFGDLDCLCTIDGGRGYEELIEHAQEIVLSDTLRMKVLSLEELVAVKKRAGRPKDLAAIPVLEATIEERAWK